MQQQMHVEHSLYNEVSQAEYSAPDTPAGASAPAVEQWVEDPRDGRCIKRSVYEARQAATRARNTPNQRNRRAKLRAAEKAEQMAILAELGPRRTAVRVQMRSEEFVAEVKAPWQAWIALDGPRQRQYRLRDPRLYPAARKVLVEMRRELWMDPEPAAFALRLSEIPRISVDRHAAKNLLRQLHSLEGKGGPWSASVTGFEQPSPAVTSSEQPSRAVTEGEQPSQPGGVIS